jgi:transcriptional regulator with XRE-family HTH domain
MKGGAVETASPFGARLRRWRRHRGISQLTLAGQVGSTPRHISFLETGRSRPSRQMVLRLGEVLAVSLRERNQLLAAAGLPDVYPQAPVTGPQLAPYRAAIDRLLHAHQPYPLPRRWNRKDAEQVYFCDEILRTGSVTWYWPGASVNAPARSVAGLLAHGPLPRLSMSGTSDPEGATVQLFGHGVPLPGVMRMKITDVVVANTPALAALIGHLPPWAPVAMSLVADDLTACMFVLDEADDVPSDNVGAPDLDQPES